MKFEKYNFHPLLKKNLADKGFIRPTDIQYKSIPPILKGEDVLAVAQTGTGKTAAFAIPVIEILFNRQRRREDYEVRCLVMVPTHELALQVAGVFESLLKGLGLKVLALFGGVEQEPQINRLKKGVDILVATPGRMFDLSSQGYLSFKSIEVLILDEADHMLELGFYNDMRQLFSQLPRRKQTLFFSATIDEKIKDLAYSLVRHAVRIHISPKNPVSGKIDHAVTYVEMDHKRFFLERIIREHSDSKILVFVRTKVRAERVLQAMERVGITAESIHSDKDQKTRNSVMSNFREGRNKVLIATDVSARGVDIPNVEMVVNYDLPDIPENYVHRVGRTGRGVNRGKAISFCSYEERETLAVIEEFLTNPITVIDMAKTEYEASIDFSQEAVHDWKSLIEEDFIKGTKKKTRKK